MCVDICFIPSNWINSNPATSGWVWFKNSSCWTRTFNWITTGAVLDLLASVRMKKGLKGLLSELARRSAQQFDQSWPRRPVLKGLRSECVPGWWRWHGNSSQHDVSYTRGRRRPRRLRWWQNQDASAFHSLPNQLKNQKWKQFQLKDCTWQGTNIVGNFVAPSMSQRSQPERWSCGGGEGRQRTRNSALRYTKELYRGSNSRGTVAVSCFMDLSALLIPGCVLCLAGRRAVVVVVGGDPAIAQAYMV